MDWIDWLGIAVIVFAFVAGIAFWEGFRTWKDHKRIRRDARGRFTKG